MSYTTVESNNKIEWNNILSDLYKKGTSVYYVIIQSTCQFSQNKNKYAFISIEISFLLRKNEENIRITEYNNAACHMFFDLSSFYNIQRYLK